MPGDTGGTYTMLRRDGKDLGGLYEIPGNLSGQVPPHWALYIYVDDVDQVAAKAT